MWYSNAATSLAHWLLQLFPGCPLKEFCCLFPQIVVLCFLNTKIMSGFFCVCVLSRMSCVQLFATLWTVAHLWGSSVLGILQANILEWVACHALHQGIFPTQGLNLHLYISCIDRQVLHPYCHLGNPQVLSKSRKQYQYQVNNNSNKPDLYLSSHWKYLAVPW